MCFVNSKKHCRETKRSIYKPTTLPPPRTISIHYKSAAATRLYIHIHIRERQLDFILRAKKNAHLLYTWHDVNELHNTRKIHPTSKPKLLHKTLPSRVKSNALERVHLARRVAWLWLSQLKRVRGLCLVNLRVDTELAKLRVYHRLRELFGSCVIEFTRASGRHLKPVEALHVLHDPGMDTQRREIEGRIGNVRGIRDLTWV